jgi:Copper type II ascorbate-dependent monooxygenase, C-terminal domain
MFIVKVRTLASVTVLFANLAAAASALAPPPALSPRPRRQSGDVAPTFYRDVLPILQKHCQVCHRSGGIAPISFESYDRVARKADKIADAVTSGKMPPWFADPKIGHFSNDPSLSAAEIETLTSWAGDGAPAGDSQDAPPPLNWSGSWNIPQPDIAFKMPVPVEIPAQGEIEYNYEIIPTGFKTGKWIQMSQVLPSSPQNVHHAVVYVRPPDSKWLRGAPVGKPFTASTLSDKKLKDDAQWTDSDVLLVYAPGSSPDFWPASMAKFIPAGSDLVFQIHYTTNGHASSDQSSIGLVFSNTPPPQRVLTLQLTNDSFEIPPGADDYRVEVHGSLPNDCILLSFFPHMHLRGKRFEYNIVHKDGSFEPLLRVNYHFHWQMSYRLAEPLPLKAGTILQAVAWFDNSARNEHNPDPKQTVRWGDQTSDEMMVGFFDVAVASNLDKQHFFIRPSAAK